MGLGKTVATLTAFVDLLATKEVKRVLVIAPLRVATHTWPTEIENWDHLRGLTYKVLAGLPPMKREAAFNTAADIHIINRENVQWLVKISQDQGWPYDSVVIDESSSFKSHSSQRWKSLRSIVKKNQIQRMVQLTGTPTPNSLMELWPQLYLLDLGARLGDTRGKFLARYCRPVGHPQWSQYEIRADMVDEIHEKVADLALRMEAADYLNLPERVDSNVVVQIPALAKALYEGMAREFIVQLQAGEVLAPNAAVVVNKLLQISTGSMYVEDTYQVVHDAKIDALLEIVEAATEPVLIAFNFRADADRILARVKNAKLLGKQRKMIDDWNSGKIPVLLAHPASAGHGLNLQGGGSLIVWFGVPWSLELYQQFNARLHRQGQKKPVRVVHILADTPIDHAVVKGLADKQSQQDTLLSFIKKSNF